MINDTGILAGIDKFSGEIKTIDQVASGIACNCKCADCDIALVAKKGQQNAHHFAHDSLPLDIRRCQETALHLAAKYVAASLIRRLHIPARVVKAKSTEDMLSPGGYWVSKQSAIALDADDVERLSGAVEPVVPDISPYRPDARIETPQGPIYVEIRVTHPVPSEKQSAMVRENLAVIELDFSNVARSNLRLAHIETLVSSKTPRNWLSDGLNLLRAQEVLRLNAEVKSVEKAAQEAMMSQLRVELTKPLPVQVEIQALFHQPTGLKIRQSGFVTTNNARRINGFTMCDLPGMPNTLVAAIDDDSTINRLFTWHQSIKQKPLSVLCMSRTPTVLTSSDAAFKRLLSHIHGNEQMIPAPIRRAHVINRNMLIDLVTPVTKKLISILGERAYISSSIHHNAAHALVKHGLFDLVIGCEDGIRETYLSEQLAKQLNGIR